MKRHALPAQANRQCESYACACVGCGNASHNHPLCRKHRRMLPEGAASLLGESYAAAEKMAQHRTPANVERRAAERAYRERLNEAVAMIMALEIEADDLRWRLNA